MMVECPVCNDEFDIAKRGPVCPNGHPHPDAENGDNGGKSGDSPEFACDACGSTEAKPGDVFCPDCGEDLEPKPEPDDACPSCGEEVDADAKFCSSCGTLLDEDQEDDSELDHVVLESDGGEVTAENSETVGGALRNAAVNGGASKDDARKIHREHVKFEIDNGVTMEVLGVNPTIHEGEELKQGDRVEVEEGDTVEFSRTLETTVKFE